MRPAIDLEPWRESIASWISDGLNQAQILSRLQHAGLTTGRTTLTKALQRWHVRTPSRQHPLEDSDELHERIEFCFRELRLTDEETVAMLQKEGFTISKRQLQRWRVQQGFLKRVPRALHDAQNETTASLLREEYEEGNVEPYGVGNLYTFMRAKYGVVGRNRLREIAMQIDPEGFERRRQRALPRIGTVVARGPNHVWSMDAHCKLEAYGVQIYAAIDAYSRFIQWLYVGISGRTAVSVLVQYLRTLADGGILPDILRSDRGSETTMAADAHYYLSSLVRPRVNGESLEFSDCFRYGTSKLNQRIEGYWGQQAKMTLNRWRAYFAELSSEGSYDHDSSIDRIAFLAIYMPILRTALQHCVQLWNQHSIRKQPRRPHVVSGKPWMLYHHPERSGGMQCGTPISADVLQPLQDEHGEIDLEEYLPSATIQWCNQCLEASAFEVPVQGGTRSDEISGLRVHREAYLCLRAAIHRHLLSGRDPQLSETPRLSRAYSWQPRMATRSAFERAGEQLMQDEDSEDPPSL